MQEHRCALIEESNLISSAAAVVYNSRMWHLPVYHLLLYPIDLGNNAKQCSHAKAHNEDGVAGFLLFYDLNRPIKNKHALIHEQQSKEDVRLYRLTLLPLPLWGHKGNLFLSGQQNNIISMHWPLFTAVVAAAERIRLAHLLRVE